MTPSELKRWVAVGTGVGIEVAGEDLVVTVVRVRPNGARLLGAAAIKDFRQRPASEWGNDYAAFLGGFGAAHVPATLVLPRRDVIVRQLALPGVADAELANAIGYQADSLHPFDEDETVLAWRRLPGTPSVLLGITRRPAMDAYLALFHEAGIRIAAITFSASVLFSASRLFGAAVPPGLLVLRPLEDGVEAYGESPARPVFSASFQNGAAARAATLALAELRLDPETRPLDITQLLPPAAQVPEGVDPAAVALPYAAALASACPRLAPVVNLLPESERASASRAVFIPSLVLGAALLAVLVGLASYQAVAERRYLDTLNQEIRKLEPRARQVAILDRRTETARARARLLDEFRRRTRADLDSLNELTRVLPPPIFVSNLEMGRTVANLSGEAEQAAPLLHALDSSPLFRDSQFTMPFQRTGKVEQFRIRTQREEASK
jgi:Tfp pilus assembly protein PilN